MGMTLGFVFLGTNCCNDWSTFAISCRVLITSTLLFESWYHSSRQRYCFKNLLYCFYCASEYCKDLFITQLPFVVCAIHSIWNKFPFCSEDWHFVPSISPFLIIFVENHVHFASLSSLILEYVVYQWSLNLFHLPSDP